MKALAFISLIAVVLPCSSATASAQSNLAQAAVALEDSLKLLNKQFDRRGDRFRENGDPLFRALEKSRDDADKIAKSAGVDFSPRFAVEPSIIKLQEHISELQRSLRLVDLTRVERNAADLVDWNLQKTMAFWSRYNPGVAPAPSPEQRARRIATDYLLTKYNPPSSALRIDAISPAGPDFLVFATIRNATTYRLIVSPRAGRVLSETVIYPGGPQRPPAPFTDAERARTYATQYATDKYNVPARDLNLGKATDLGKLYRVVVGVKGVGVRVIDVDPRSGRIYADKRG